MKAGIHPDNYRVVVFKDMSDGTQFFSRSTAATKDSIEIDGVKYPLIKLEISNTSHPFYTGPPVAWTNSCPVTATALASNAENNKGQACACPLLLF